MCDIQNQHLDGVGVLLNRRNFVVAQTTKLVRGRSARPDDHALWTLTCVPRLQYMYYVVGSLYAGVV